MAHPDITFICHPPVFPQILSLFLLQAFLKSFAFSNRCLLLFLTSAIRMTFTHESPNFSWQSLLLLITHYLDVLFPICGVPSPTHRFPNVPTSEVWVIFCRPPSHILLIKSLKKYSRFKRIWICFEMKTRAPDIQKSIPKTGCPKLVGEMLNQWDITGTALERELRR